MIHIRLYVLTKPLLCAARLFHHRKPTFNARKEISPTYRWMDGSITSNGCEDTASQTFYLDITIKLFYSHSSHSTLAAWSPTQPSRILNTGAVHDVVCVPYLHQSACCPYSSHCATSKVASQYGTLPPRLLSFGTFPANDSVRHLRLRRDKHRRIVSGLRMNSLISSGSHSNVGSHPTPFDNQQCVRGCLSCTSELYRIVNCTKNLQEHLVFQLLFAFAAHIVRRPLTWLELVHCCPYPLAPILAPIVAAKFVKLQQRKLRKNLPAVSVLVQVQM